ncbi:VanZ family protein [Kribbella qitaiheensis]|uniref:VanZ family protein n=1 Tax=Kribbella qitaiheensis TaxID=1544730 RepID=A0A7G6X053_9ACTN|nr:VanZ family protein [Kribbella qitaiheensis]QNE19618.1 VanZ family protein [Kribbella qitaiheensis]
MTPDSLVIPAAVVALAFLAWVLLRLVRLTRQGDFIRAAHLASASTALWGLGLLLATLGGRPQDSLGRIWFNWVPFATQTAANDTEIVMNFLLFVPAGLLLPWIARHATRQRVIVLALGAAAMLSSVIEVLQTFTPLGTAGDITDILSNTIGCTIAAAISSIVHHWLVSQQLTRSAPEARQLQS